jgi:hypothetical protein
MKSDTEAHTKLIPLKDAPWAFASQRQRSDWRRAQDTSGRTKTSKSNSTEIELLGKQASGSRAETVKNMSEAVKEFFDNLAIRSAPQWAAQESLLQKLRDGELEACGVQSAPKQKRQLEVLPDHFFVDAKIGWGTNRVKNFGVTYSAVRVRRVTSATQPPKEREDPLSAPSGRGRPSKTVEIARAIDLLVKRGVDLAKMQRTKAYETVRMCAKSELKSDIQIGFSDPVIQRSLHNRFGHRR